MSSPGDEPVAKEAVTTAKSNPDEPPKPQSGTGEAPATDTPAAAPTAAAETSKKDEDKDKDPSPTEDKKDAESPAEAVTAVTSRKSKRVRKSRTSASADDPAGAVTSKMSKTKTGRPKGEKATVENALIGFIGAGRMTEAIVRGLVEKKCNLSCFVASKSGKTHDSFKQLGCTVTKRLYDIFAKHECDVIFIAVHGMIIKECYKLGGSRPLALAVNFIPVRSQMYHILSLVGGVSVADIKNVLLNPDMPEKYKLDIHRVMLNAAVAYGIGLGCIDVEPDSKKVQPLIRDLLVKIAKVECFPETLMDILCCVGGNGLAFIYYYVAALADGGFKMGLPKKTAVTLATKTLHSSALCMLESGKNTAELRDQCTSPSGPAIYGIANLEKKDCASGISQAVEEAFKRLRQLVDTPCL